MGQGYEKLFPKVTSQEFVHLLQNCTHCWCGSEAVHNRITHKLSREVSRWHFFSWPSKFSVKMSNVLHIDGCFLKAYFMRLWQTCLRTTHLGTGEGTVLWCCTRPFSFKGALCRSGCSCLHCSRVVAADRSGRVRWLRRAAEKHMDVYLCNHCCTSICFFLRPGSAFQTSSVRFFLNLVQHE